MSASANPAERLFALELPVEVWLASESVPLGTLLDLTPGAFLPLATDPDAQVDLVVNGETIASGELVVVDGGRFGLRVTTTPQATAQQRLARSADGSGREETS
jgi:flagellar motor switch/type III secretory pathway protein FliN